MNVNELIGPHTFAAAAQIHYDTVMRWRRSGKLPPYDLALGRHLRGWTLDTLRAHNPAWASLVEQHLVKQRAAARSQAA